jgi:hypothetical protein
MVIAAVSVWRFPDMVAYRIIVCLEAERAVAQDREIALRF